MSRVHQNIDLLSTAKGLFAVAMVVFAGCQASEEVTGDGNAPDIQSPNVAFVSPVAGAGFNIGPTTGTTVGFEATATDNVNITKVEFYSKTTTAQTLLCTATSSPYKCNAKLPAGLPAGNTKIAAIAYDSDGHSTLITRTIAVLCPAISTTIQSPNFVISWTDAGEGCVLQSSTSVIGPYSAVTGSIISTGTSRVYLAPLTASSLFFKTAVPGPTPSSSPSGSPVP
jgi:hypothetical protein